MLESMAATVVISTTASSIIEKFSSMRIGLGYIAAVMATSTTATTSTLDLFP